ncbi:MAG: HAMP domain-containing histidine kinase [Anaerolineales bacterium]|nr:HAMP domain-containing histidine kinase [Anaerolineales bacterium]
MSNIDTQHFLQFLTTWVHDIRTPLASIAASAEILEHHGGNHTLDQSVLIGLIARNNYRVVEEIDFLADYWRLQYLAEPIQPVPMPLQALIDQAQLGLARLLTDDRPQLDLSIPPELPQLLTDEWLVKAFINLLLLLANSDRGPATTIQVRASRTAGDRVQIVLEGNYPHTGHSDGSEVKTTAWDERYTFVTRIITQLYDGGLQHGATPGSLCYRLQLPVAP